MALYSEHSATPEQSDIELDHAARTAREQIKTPPHVWEREIAAEVIMSRTTARALRDWLTGRLDLADKIDADPTANFVMQPQATSSRYADSN